MEPKELLRLCRSASDPDTSASVVSSIRPSPMLERLARAIRTDSTPPPGAACMDPDEFTDPNPPPRLASDYKLAVVAWTAEYCTLHELLDLSSLKKVLDCSQNASACVTVPCVEAARLGMSGARAASTGCTTPERMEICYRASRCGLPPGMLLTASTSSPAASILLSSASMRR